MPVAFVTAAPAVGLGVEIGAGIVVARDRWLAALMRVDDSIVMRDV